MQKENNCRNYTNYILIIKVEVFSVILIEASTVLFTQSRTFSSYYINLIETNQSNTQYYVDLENKRMSPLHKVSYFHKYGTRQMFVIPRQDGRCCWITCYRVSHQ